MSKAKEREEIEVTEQAQPAALAKKITELTRKLKSVYLQGEINPIKLETATNREVCHGK